jgi:hypothetical protein
MWREDWRMAADDLTAPLRQETKRGRSFSAAITASMPQAIAIALATFLGAFVLWAVIAENPFGGEPMAVVQISPPGPMAPRVIGGPNAVGAAESGPGRYDGPPDGPITIPVPPGLPALPAPGMAENPANGANTRTVTGARQEVVIPGSSEPPDTPGAPTTPGTPSVPLSEAQPNDQKLVVRTLSCSSLFNQLAPGLPARGRSVSQRVFTLSSENPLPWCHRWP